jgi:hypothetical protein
MTPSIAHNGFRDSSSRLGDAGDGFALAERSRHFY